MVITYHGASFCRATQGDTTIAFSPAGKEGTLSFVGKPPFVIDGAGEYELRDIIIRGFAPTIYTVVWDDIVLCHLGQLSSATLPPDVLEEIGDVDVLIVPTGYEGAPSAKDLIKLTKHIEPSVIIPLEGSGPQAALEFAAFQKEVASHPEPLERFTFKRRELDDKNGELVLLSNV